MQPYGYAVLLFFISFLDIQNSTIIINSTTLVRQVLPHISTITCSSKGIARLAESILNYQHLWQILQEFTSDEKWLVTKFTRD